MGYQCFAKGARQAGDEMGIALPTRASRREIWFGHQLAPKPLGATDWNGSECTPIFPMKFYAPGSQATMKPFVKLLTSCEHIAVYGADNDQRLTGDHETRSITEFSYGVSDQELYPYSYHDGRKRMERRS